MLYQSPLANFIYKEYDNKPLANFTHEILEEDNLQICQRATSKFYFMRLSIIENRLEKFVL